MLELVERQELDRILSEQKLTRQFATDAANYGQVARLLRADALLLINGRQVAGTKVVETRLIRVNPGLVLDTVYTAIPIAQPTQWAEPIGSRVAGLAAKLIRHDAIALSLLNIRASVSSSAGRGLDRTLAVLLSDRLTHQPHFVVLERAAMERLASENTGEFWTGSYLVDGTLEPALDGSGAFVLAVRFQPAGRAETLAFTTVGRRADPAAAVDEVLNRINARLAQAAPPARRDLAGEALPNLILNWSSAHVVVRLDQYSSSSTSLRLSPGDEASHHLSNELRSSPAPEDRYFAALLAMWTASQHREATTTDLERLRTCLWDVRELLAQGGEVFSVYWERFAALDKLNGVPFFDLKRSFSPDGHRMWDRHTPEHAEFRRQLYLGLCAFARRPDPQFQRILAQDQFTPEQQAEVLAARARLGSPTSSPSASSQGGMVVRPRVAPATAASTPAPQPPVNGAPSLRVLRLWTPFDLGLNIPPEFEADFGSMTWAEGRLWLHGSTFNRGGQPDQHFIFAIDPATMRTETFPIPQRAATLNARFLVTTTNLVFAVRDFLAVFDRAGDRWDIYAEINPANLKPPVLVGDSVYLIVKESPGNALISFDLNRRATEVLASTRRKPAASPFDDPGIEIKSLTSNEAGELVVVAETFDHPVPQIERESHAWSPTQRAWREIHPRKLKSAVPMNPQSVRAEFGRVGTIHRSGTTLTLRLSREEAPATEIPLIFLRQAADRVPESRYGPQNIWPAYCNSFAAGVTLVPASGSGFWVVPQNELDDYLQQSAAATRPAASARN